MFCENRNILFIHIPKTAGSTVEILLEPYAGQRVELLKRPEKQYDWENDIELHIKQVGIKHAKHWTVEEHVKHWKFKNLDSITTFTIVRNPYERMLKLFLFKLQNGELLPRSHEPGYKEHLEKRRGKHIIDAILKNWDYNMYEQFLLKTRDVNRMGSRTFWSARKHCTYKGQLKLDHIIKYENLDTDLPRVFEKLNLPIPDSIPVTNSTIEINSNEIKNYYSATSRLIVEDNFHDDFEPFGYKKWK